MKDSIKVLLVLSFILQIQSTILSNNQRINSFFYMTGNIYVYLSINYSSFPYIHDSSFVRCKITKDSVINSKKYYYFDSFGVVFNSSGWYRYDSTSGRLLKLNLSVNCNNYFKEDLVDSMWADLHDSVRYCSTFVNVCIDTNMKSILGISRGSLTFNKSFGGGGHWSSDTYYYSDVIGITGFYSSSSGSIGSGYSRSLIMGALVNGVVFGDTTVYIVGVKQISSEIPANFKLFQNYPNPFNPSTNIQYQIISSGFVLLRVYDIMGREIETLVNQKQLPGIYETNFEAAYLPSGVYIYTLSVGENIETRKMVLIK